MTDHVVSGTTYAASPALAHLTGSYDCAVFAQYILDSSMSPTGQTYAGDRWAKLSKRQMAADLFLSQGQINRIIDRLSELGILYRTKGTGRVALSRIDRDTAESFAMMAVERVSKTVHMSSVDAYRNQYASDADRDATPITGFRDKDTHTHNTATHVEIDTHEPSAGQDTQLLTPGQLANQIQKGYWQWVRERTGRYPVSINVHAFKALITPFLEAGVEPAAIKRAVATMYETGAPFTRQVIERTIDGRATRRGPKPMTQQLREMEFDAQGNLVL